MKIRVELSIEDGPPYDHDAAIQFRHMIGEPWFVDYFRYGPNGQIATIGKCEWMEGNDG